MLKIAYRFVETFKNYVSYISSHVNLVIRAVLNSSFTERFHTEAQGHNQAKTQKRK